MKRALTKLVSLSQLRAMAPGIFRHRPVRRVDVFGSVARGEAGPDSDLDVLVEFVPGARASLLEMGAIREDLEDALGRPVDVVSRRAVERSRNPCRKRAILNGSVTIYAR